jgi:hypothetical protein
VGGYQIGGFLGPSHGFLLSGGSFSTVDVPGSTYSAVYGLNDHGQIVGAYGLPGSNSTQGFLLDGGDFTAIAVPGSSYTRAAGINNAGDIAGLYYDANTLGHGFLLSGGIYTTVDVPGSTLTFILGINDAGQIVGFYDDRLGNQHGFLATPVPEPLTLILFCIASLACGYWKWRREAAPSKFAANASGLSQTCFTNATPG